MSKQEDDFFEVNNEVPFQPIQNIKIESVEVKEHDIHLRVKMVLSRGSDSQFVDLVRSDQDVQWLLQNLSNQGQCSLLPKVDSQGSFSQLVSLISGTQPIRIKKLKLLKEKVLHRCLTIISSILLEHLKTIDIHYQIPIFVFFHQNFALYHNPIYFKEGGVSIKKKVGNYFWEKYALLTGRGTTWEGTKKQLVEERERLSEVTVKLHQYLSQLHKLQEEFIAERERIKKRAMIAEELEISFEMQLRYLDLVIEEAKETAARAEQQHMQGDKMMTHYGQLLLEEGQEALKANQKLLAEYVKVMCQNQDQLRIAPY